MANNGLFRKKRQKTDMRNNRYVNGSRPQSKAGGYLFALIFILFGIGMIIGGITLYSNMQDTYGYASVEGQISRIDVQRRQTTGKTKYSYTPYVKYVVDNVTYETSLNYYTSTMHQGDSITIYYNENNPNDIKVNEGSILVLVSLSVMGFIFFIAGVVVFWVFKRQSGQPDNELIISDNSSSSGFVMNTAFDSFHRNNDMQPRNNSSHVGVVINDDFDSFVSDRESYAAKRQHDGYSNKLGDYDK